MWSIRHIFVLLLGSLYGMGCSQIIEFETHSSEVDLVIFGTLTNSSVAPNSVRITYTEQGDTIETVTHAEVTVIDDLGKIIPYEYVPEFKRYEPKTPGFAGVPGHSYYIEVFVNGNTYHSIPEELPISKTKDSVFFHFGKRTLTSNQGVSITQDVVNIVTSGTVENVSEPVYLKWDVEEIFIFTEALLSTSFFPFYSPGNCYVVQPYITSAIPLFNSNESSLFEINLVTEVIDSDFKGFHAFGIVQSTLTAEAFDYWTKIEEASNRIASIFETPPGPVSGNLFNIDNDNDRPLGYFAAVSVDSTTIGTTEADLPVFIPGDPPPGCSRAIALQSLVPFNCFQCLVNDGVPEACVDCTSLPGSTRVRPSYLNDF